MAIKAFSLFGEISIKGDKIVVSDLKKVSHQVDVTKKDLGSLSKGFHLGGGALSGLNSALGTLSNISNTIQGIPVIGSLINGAISTVTGPVKDLAQLGLGFNDLKENATLAFSVILKDGKKAVDLVDKLSELGRKSPIFKTGQLITSAQQFLPQVGAGKELFETLNGIGALTALTGHLEWMGDISLAFMQMGGRQKASMEEFSQQLADKGLMSIAFELASHATGYSVAELQEKIQAGKISGSGLRSVILSQANKEYGSIVDLMGQTREGKQAQIDDTLEQKAARGTQNLHAAWKQGQDRILTGLNGPQGDKLADQINAVTGDIGKLAFGGLDSLLDGSFLNRMQKVGEDVKSGISKGFDGVTTGISNAAQYVLGFKSGIGANSPAKEFIPLGQYAAEGFLLGFETYLIGEGGPMALFQGKGARFAGGNKESGNKESQAQRRAENEKLLQLPAIQAMMDAIGVGEGTFNPKTGQRDWMKWFGNASFTPTAEHPGISPVPFFNKKTGKWDHSSAAGGGQFLRSTWSGVEQDIGDLDFNNLHDQMLAFVEKMRDRGMIGAILRGDIRQAMALGNEEWASLPGSPHKQPTVKEATVIDTFEKRLGFYANGQPITATNPMPVTMAPTGGNVPSPVTDKKLMDDFNTTQLVAKAVTNVNAVIAAGQATKNVNTALGIQAKVTEEKAIPGLEKLGETAKTSAEEIAKNKKLLDIPGAAEKKKRDPLFDQAFTRVGATSDFHGGLSALLGNLGWEKPSSLGKQFLFGFLRDAQGRVAHDFSSMITEAIFGGRNEKTGDLEGGLFDHLLGRTWGNFKLGSPADFLPGAKKQDHGGNWFSSLLSSIFGGARASGGPIHPGRMYLVGEHGPELFAPGGGGHVYNNRETRGMLSAGNNEQAHITVAIGPRAVADAMDDFHSSPRGRRRMMIHARYNRKLQGYV